MLEIKKRLNGQACLIVCDNAPSHDGGDMTRPVQGGQSCQWLRQMNDVDGVFLYMTLKNKSHLCNPGDQQINSSLRRVCRRAGKIRLARHALAGLLPPPKVCILTSPLCTLRTGEVMPDATLQMGEGMMKNLLIRWLGEWISSDLQETIVSSWKSVTTLVEVDGPLGTANHVIFLPDSGLFSCTTSIHSTSFYFPSRQL